MGDAESTLGADAEDVHTLDEPVAASPSGSYDEPPFVPQRLGRYLVIERLGAGAMGVVYSAYDPQLDRKVAIKLLLPGRGGELARTRLVREAQAMARLSHPHVVAVHDVGEHGGSVYIAMEFVSGPTLRRWLAQERRSWKDALTMYVRAGRGLAAAHTAGVVHRDFKPDNVLIDESGRARVTDFGLARASTSLDESRSRSDHHASDDSLDRSGASAVMTRPGKLVGSPAYMAPELYAGAPADPCTDQFAFCVSLWEGMYGRRPFAGETTAAVAYAMTNGEIQEPPRGARVPRWLRRVVQRGLATDPAARWPSMDALVGQLARGRFRAVVRAAVMVLVAIMAMVVLAEAWRRSSHATTIAECEALGASMTEVWPGAEQSVRETLRARLLSHGVRFSATTADKVQPWLDAYARDWERARAQTCILHRAERAWDDDLALAADECFEQTKVELAAVIDELVGAEVTILHEAVMMAASLAPIERCADPSALRQRPPVAARDAGELAAIHEALARAQALRAAGRREDAIVAAERALALAPTEALQARAQYLLGRALERAGDYEQAERRLVDAYVLAAKTGATELVREAAAWLVFVVGYRRARHDDGLLWARLGEIDLARPGVRQDDLLEALRLTNVALVHAAMGTYAEAQAAHERALAVYERALGPEHPKVATIVNNLAIVHYELGEWERARSLYERALTIAETAFGTEHPDVADYLNNLGNVDLKTGAYAQAKARIEQALEIRQRVHGPTHSDVGQTLNNLAIVHYMMGQLDEARIMYERALTIYETTLGPHHPELGKTLNNLGRVYRDRGEWAQARALHERALTIYERALGPEHPDVAWTLSNLAAIHNWHGEHADAMTLNERALAIREQALGADHPEVAESLSDLARVRVARGEPEQARPLLERARAIQEASLGRDHPDIAKTLASLGDVHVALSDLRSARTLYEDALALREQALGSDHALVAASLTDLGKVALAEDRFADAVAMLDRAMAIQQARASSVATLSVTRFLLAQALWGSDQDRARALDLAERAALTLRNEGRTRELAEVEAWLSTR